MSGVGRMEIKFYEVQVGPEFVQKFEVEFSFEVAEAHGIGEETDDNTDENQEVAVQGEADDGAENFAPVLVPESFKVGFKE